MNKKYIFGTLAFLLIGIASWTLYSVFNQGLEDMLLFFGVSNFYLQGFIILTFIAIILFLLGKTKIFDKIIGK